MMSEISLRFSAPVVVGVILFWSQGCSKPDSVIRGTSSSDEAIPRAAALENSTEQLIDRLHQALKAVNPEYDAEKTALRSDGGNLVSMEFVGCGLRDVSPLAKLPAPVQQTVRVVGITNCPVEDLSPLGKFDLQELYLDTTAVKDLRPLRGMELNVLWVQRSPLSDLSPIAKLPLRQLNLMGSPITDLSPLASSSLQMLWLNETPVTDLTPLVEVPLVSLTLHKTPVRDLSPLAKMATLQRLHIAETEIADLSPLKSLRLQRLIFTPGKITAGLDWLRKNDSLRELDVKFGDEGYKPLSPAEFWKKFDAGEWR